MSDNSHLDNEQSFNLSDGAKVRESQIGGQASGDLTSAQNQGSGNIFQGVTFNLLDTQPSKTVTRLSRQEYRNRQALLNKVKHYWIEGVLQHSLSNLNFINLDLEARPEALAQPWEALKESIKDPKQDLFQGIQAIDIFDQSVSCGNLLILGEPGAGKTTMLLSLAQELTERAEQDIEQPIPVVFNLSSWLVNKQTLAEWLVSELNVKYQVPHKIGQNWVDENLLLLLLDGLDEVRQSDRERCINEINAFRQENCVDIIVCSRAKDYAALAHRLNFQNAIYLRPMTLEQIRQSLMSGDSGQTNIWALIQKDYGLQELAKNPLMLNLMTMSYRGIEPGVLSKMDQLEAQSQYLFDAYIQRMLKRWIGSSKYSQKQTIQWLSCLAFQMNNFSQSVFQIEGMQPSWLNTSTQQAAYWIMVKSLLIAPWGCMHVGLLVGQMGYDLNFLEYMNIQGGLYGLLGGLLYGLIGGILATKITESANPHIWRVMNGLLLGSIYGPIFGWAQGKLIYGIAYTFIYWIIGFLIYDFIQVGQKIEAVEDVKFSWKKASNIAPFGLMIGIAFYFGTPNALIPSIIFGLMISLIFSFSKKDDIDSRTLPNQGMWKSASNCIKLFITIGLTTALLLGILDLFLGMFHPIYILVNGMYLGFASALLGGNGAGITCIKHFTLRCLLWWNGYGPWNYARFLDFAADCILLKKVGGSYVFIHRLLLEHFAKKQMHLSETGPSIILR